MRLEPSFQPCGALVPKRKALVVCAHLRPGRDKRRTTYLMQPISGLQVGSLIDQTLFDVSLHHEDWHGPLDPANCKGYDLVFLSGLQVDFDRMRQLSFCFRRSGAVVVADFLNGSLKAIYRSPIAQISSYAVDYSLLAKSRINPSVHLIEASRG